MRYFELASAGGVNGQLALTKKLCAVLAAVLLAVLIPGPSRAAEDPSIAPSASMNEQVLMVTGDTSHPVQLQVTVLAPSGAGPFPMVVMNHGAPGKPRTDLEPRYRFSFSSYYFLSRGYAVVLPMMRGFAGSQGKQSSNGCNQEAVGLSNAKDIYSVIDYMLAQPYINPSKVIVAGQSFGGWNALALGTLAHPQVVGVINFSGGLIISNCEDTPSALAQGAAHFGGRARVPSIWFYGDNDTKFSTSTWHAMYERYTQAGGQAELVAYGQFMQDAHNLLGYPEGLRIWAPRVDAFLARLGMPNQITHPEYLPMEPPPPTHYAAIGDVNAVPYLTDEGRKLYQRYLSDPMPKVFALSVTGMAAAYHGGFDPLGRALQICQKNNQKCRIYAVDDDVTWAAPTRQPPASGYAALDNAAAVPYVNDSGRQGYQRFLALPKPRAFVVAPDGAWALSARDFDVQANALQACQTKHQGCRVYAVDDQVVWSR